jgi:hypothetical protein
LTNTKLYDIIYTELREGVVEMKISYEGKNEYPTPVAIITIKKESEVKKLNNVIKGLEQLGYNTAGFNSGEDLLYMIDVDDKDDFNELKKEYMKLKRS